MKNSAPFLNPKFLLLFFMLASTLVNAADISVTTFGITGTGDESAKLQTAFDSIAGTGNTLTIPSGMTITVTKNMFLYGSCSIRGLDVNNSSTIQCDADLSNDLGRQYWISVGISRHRNNGGVQNTFNGSIKDMTIKATSNAKFSRAIFIFNTNGTTIDNVKFDFTSGVSNPPDCLFGATESGNNGNWEPNGATSMTNVTIKNSIINTNHSHTDSEGFGLCNVNIVLIDNNTLNNIGDDPIGCHNATNVTISNNTCYSIDGRILVDNCTNATISGNYVERVAERGTTWYGGGAMIYAGLEIPGAPAPGNITVTNNTVVIPSSVPAYTYGIRLLGVRTAAVSSNLLKMDSANGGCCIRIEADTSQPSWNDPAIPQLDADHIARPRDVTISNNVLSGSYPGGIEQTGVSANLTGPFTVQNNTAGSYCWFSNNCFIYNSNLINNGSYAAFAARMNTIYDPATIYNDTVLHAKPSQTLTGTQYACSTAGRISGYTISTTPAITSGTVSLELWKNSTEISAATQTLGTGSSGDFYLPYNNTDVAFVPGDTFVLKAVGSSTLNNVLPNGIAINVVIKGLETTQAAFYKFDDGSGIYATDSSGNNNTGTISGATWDIGDGIITNALNFDSNDNVTVSNNDTLNIADNLTISFWIKPNAITSGYASFPVAKWTSTSDANYVCYFFGDNSGGFDGKIRFLANAGGTWQSISVTSPVIQLNTWTHVAMVYKSTTGGQLYINGLPYGTKVGSGVLAINGASLTMGIGNTSGLNAKLDDVRIFSRTLTDAEILSIYKYKY